MRNQKNCFPWYWPLCWLCPWASRQGLVSGYGGGLFGPNDPVTREQMTAIFWRYADSPSADSAALSEGEAASSYALPAINWAVSSGVVAPVSGTAFAPRDNATRAQVAAALMNYHRMTQLAGDARILIAYFTVPETSSVDAVAQARLHLPGHLRFLREDGNPLYRPRRQRLCRNISTVAAQEPNAQVERSGFSVFRNSVSTTKGDIVDWVARQIAAYTGGDLAENDLSGKIVAPFCTSSYSPITNSLHIFRELASGASIAEGLTANSESAVRPWVDQVLSRAEQ